MIRMEITERKGAKLRRRLIAAMRSGELRTFAAADRGRAVTHLRYPGRMRWSEKDGTIVATLSGPKGEPPWQLLGAFLGRIAHRYGAQVESVRLDFGPARPAGARRARPRRRLRPRSRG